MHSLRIILTGSIAIAASSGGIVLESNFPSRQARRAFARLACSRFAGLTSEQLAEAVWPGEPPRAWRPGIAALVSKLRQLFTSCLGGALPIRHEFGVYRLDLPADTWTDLDAALLAAEQAVASLRAGDGADAWARATVAASIAARPFLPGDEGGWIDAVREQLLRARLQALECLVHASIRQGVPSEAIRPAEELVKLDEYRDQSHVALMQALVAAGNPSQAIAVYHRMRTLLANELGIDPSPEAEAEYLGILRGRDLPAGVSGARP